MHIDLETEQKDVSTIQLTYDETLDFESPMKELDESMTIETDSL